MLSAARYSQNKLLLRRNSTHATFL